MLTLTILFLVYSTSFLTTYVGSHLRESRLLILNVLIYRLNSRAELRASNKSGNGNTFIGSVSLTFDPPGTTIDAPRSQDMHSVAHREVSWRLSFI
jgi:hypothetical protein